MEVMVTLAFASILVVVAVPAVGSLRDGQHVDQIISVAQELSQAATRCYRDTGRHALELTPAPDGSSYTHPRFHQLSMAQEIQGWNGPYLTQPLSREANPFGGAVYLQNDLGASPAHGFILKGIAGGAQKGPGQFVVFHGIPERIAQAVDRILDENTASKRRWRDTGRVEWAPGGGGSLSICLMKPTEEKQP